VLAEAPRLSELGDRGQLQESFCGNQAEKVRCSEARVLPGVFAALVLLAWGCAFAAIAEESTPLAKHLIEMAGKSKGVCLVPRGGELAFDLVKGKGSEFVVVSQESTAEKAAAMRAKADQAGLLGRNLYIAEADFNAPVLADNYANLLVIADATNEMLGKLDPKVMLKVLTAHGGKAIVGLAKGSTGVLTKAKLEEWAKSFGVPDARVMQDDSGLWAIVTKPQLAGAAEWTHRLFDSAFNPISTDTAFILPSMTQWLDTPYNHGAGAPRMAGGRLLMVMEGQYHSRPEVDVNFLIMRDAYNGQILWRRDLGTKYAADHYLSSVVLTADAVYLVDMPNPTVLVLDPDTGKELRRIDCATLGKQVKWIALRDGALFAAGGDTDDTGGGWLGVAGAQHMKFAIGMGSDASFQHGLAIGKCRKIAAFDLKTGGPLWVYDGESDSIPEFLIAARNGRVYFMNQEKYAGALDAKTGKLLWTNPEAAAIYRKSIASRVPGFVASTGELMAGNDILLFARPAASRIALNEADGKMLWNAPYLGHQTCCSLIWDKYVLGKPSVELRTGKPAFTEKGANPYRNICSFGAATEKYFLGSQESPAYDFSAMKPVTRAPFFHKAPCSMGSVVGEGILFMSSFHCACNYQLNGNIVEMSGDARQYQKPAVESERLTVSAKPDPAASLAMTPSDWPVFRANNNRSNASAASVPANVAQRWTYSPSKPYINPTYPSDRSETSWEPAQPIAVGNLVIASGPDGVVRAMDLTTGKPVWTFRTGGQIAQPPAVVDGRAFVASGDGFLYCLEAATGRELWRFRAAPAERRMMAYGHLVSTWPLFAGVLVQDGVVYTAASLLNMDATHVYALDAKTGHIIWQNNNSGLPDEKYEAGATAVGTLAIAQGRLWVRTISYDLKTGTCALFADPKLALESIKSGMTDNGGNALLNRNTGVIQGKYLVSGGRRFYESQSRPSQIGRSTQPISILELNADGTGIVPAITLAGYTPAFAAWDDRQMIALPVLTDSTGGNKHSPILCWDLAKTLAQVQTLRTELVKVQNNFAERVKWQENTRLAWERLGELPMQQWMLDTHRCYAGALSANAVVAAYGTMEDLGKIKEFKNMVPSSWSVTALDRATGKELWKQPLPSEPVLDGLCIARDGSVIVQLLDGGVVCLGGK